MKKIKLEHSGYEIGDLCERILLQDRSIVPPIYNSVDFTEAFANTAIWAGINPIKGRFILDSTGREVQVTDEVIIRYRYDTTSEYFVQKSDGSRLSVMNVINVSESYEYMKLECAYRGPTMAGML
jgi:head-tail adaptor|tara:strand:+ start:611 stop:985 length:375 start_codon:yes stop_codon:yes gene_type:complete